MSEELKQNPPQAAREDSPRDAAIPKAPPPFVRPYLGVTRPHYRFSQFVLRILFKLFVRAEYVGLENVPRTGGLLILPTHASYFDPPLIGASIPRESYYLARETFLSVPFWGWLVKQYNTYPIRRGASDREALRACQRILEAGWSLTFFPEGTRSPNGNLGKIKPGYLMILDGIENVPYLPVVIEGNFEVWPRSRKFPRPGKIRVRFGKAELLPAKQDGERKRDWTERCMRLLEERYRDLGARMPPAQSEAAS